MTKSSTLLTIGQVAKIVNISCDTIRLYERYGLLQTPLRDHNTYRKYQEDNINQLRFIIRAKTMGFTLKEIKNLTVVAHNKSCGYVKQLTENKLYQVTARINELKKLEQALVKVIEMCKQHRHEDLCHIFISLD